MWDGPRPRVRPPFRGGHHREMFGGRNPPTPDYMGRDHMGHMGPRPFDGPPMDVPPMDRRRMDGPPVRGHDMDPREMRRREPGRDFFRPGDGPSFGPIRQHDSFRDQMMYPPSFPGQGREVGEMRGRGMPPWEPNRFFKNRDREPINVDMSHFNRPDERRGFTMQMEGNDGFRNVPDRHPMDVGNTECYEMDMPPHERRMMDFERKGGPHINPRDRFDSDMDFRARPGPPIDFRGRDRSPLRPEKSNVLPVDKEGSKFTDPGDTVEPYPDSGGSPIMDYRCGEEMTLAEEWKSQQKEKNPFQGKQLGGQAEPSLSGQSSFHDVEKPFIGFQGKDVGFSQGDRFPTMDPAIDIAAVGSKGTKESLLLERSSLTNLLDRDRDPKYLLNKPNLGEMSYQEHDEFSREIQESNDSFMDLKDRPLPLDQVSTGENLEKGTVQTRDQDYRDIDYRTGSRRLFDYKHEELQPTEKLIECSNSADPSKITDSGFMDQDYRNASLKNKVSNFIAISGIPKATPVDQVIGAFAIRDGVPMQGLKIKNIVPGYSYDMAYVEFLNIEDAVYFMESNKGSLKVGTKVAAMKFVQSDECETGVQGLDHKEPHIQDSLLPQSEESLAELNTHLNGSNTKAPMEYLSHSQRSSDLTPEAWQQQIDQQHQQQEDEHQTDSSNNRVPPFASPQQPKSVFKDSKTMIIKNVKHTTTVETILKALDPFAYLDERNVRLVKGKPPGTKCFCFVDMDSHEQVKRLVELITKPRPLYIDGIRVHAEIARPLKNPSLRKDYDPPNPFMGGQPSDGSMLMHPPFPPHYLHPGMVPLGAMEAGMQGDMMNTNPSILPDPNLIRPEMAFGETPAVPLPYQTSEFHANPDSTGTNAPTDGSQAYIYGSEIPDVSKYLFDSTSGFYYDPETTLYYDPTSRYFYNAQTQEYLYWDGTSKTYIPVPGGSSSDNLSGAMMTALDRAILSNPAADAPLEMKKPSEPPQVSSAVAPVTVTAEAAAETSAASSATSDKNDDDESIKKDKEKESKEDKPRSLAAVKIMKDMERWAKIQNRQKESVRAPSPVLKIGAEDDKKQSKSADAAFAIFERKVGGADELFKKPITPVKKDEKSKRPMGSLGLLASDYGAGSDEEVEEDKEEAVKSSQKSQPQEKEDRLTDWKKMACLLCRRQFPNKDALVRHQQLSDLHKQNMEIHLKIKKSKKELEALENQEKELNARESSTRSPEPKRRKPHHQHQNTWAGSSRETNTVSERPGLGAEPVPRKKKEHVVWDHSTYKQAVRKAMFARYKELE